MKHSILILLACAGMNLSAQEASTNRPVLTAEFINELAEEAQRNNSGLLALESRIIAARKHAQSIPTWSDPEVMIGGMAAESMMREEDGDIMYGVEQELPVFGKEKAARQTARAEAAVEEQNYDYQFQLLRKEIAEAMFQAVLADELLELARRDLALLDTLVAAIEERYRTGGASQVDLLRTQNERSKQAEQVTTAALRRDDAYVVVNRLLNRNVHAVWGEMRLPGLAPPVYYTAKLLDIATRFEPRLKLFEKEIQRAKAAADATRKERLPDLSAGAEVTHYSGTGEPRTGTLLLKLTIPWLNSSKYEAAIERDEARVQELENLLDDYQYELRAELHHLVSMAGTARREAVLYRDEIVPRTEAALESALAAWRNGTGNFWDVLDMRRMLLEARSMHYRAVAEQWMTLADLVLCCGLGDLEAISMLNPEPVEEPETNTPDSE